MPSDAPASPLSAAWEQHLTAQQVLVYELANSWLAPHVSNPLIQKLLARYYSRKTNRKYARYVAACYRRKLTQLIEQGILKA